MIRKTLMERQMEFYKDGMESALALSEQAALADRFYDRFQGEAEGKVETINMDMDRTKVTINLHGCSGPMEALEPLRWFAREGWRMVKEPKTDSDFVTIDWHLSRADGEKATIWLIAWISGPNANCRKVQVGTTEVPVYEVKCSGPAPKALPVPGPDLVEAS
jgi:hypothetical protein